MPRADRDSTSGYLTTEFWLSVLVIITATFLRWDNKLEADAWSLAVGLNGAGYALSRGLRKMNLSR